MGSIMAVLQGAEYEIGVQGWLKEDWSDWFEGLEIDHKTDPLVGSVSVINGWVQDQTALHGLLNKIRDLNLPLLFVLCRSITDQNSERGIHNDD
jgi:hypothetical protein